MSLLALDLDGTLVSCRERQVAAAEAVAGPIDAERFWSAKQAGSTTREALAAQGVRDAEAAAHAWAASVEDERFLALDRLLPGARAALAEARAAGHRLLILTARRDAAAARLQIERLGLLALVDELVVVDPARAAEEKTRVLHLRGASGLVGDTESDARAAASAGVPFAAVAGGQRSGAFLRRHGIQTVHGGVLAAARALLKGAQLAPMTGA
jgi:phosphoglycolate phosphatase-like HAD superfamily hydrolase